MFSTSTTPALSCRRVDAVTSRLARETAIGGYEAAGEAADRIADVYDVIGALIGARREEIALVESATRAWDMVFYAVRSGRATASSPGGPSVSNYLAFPQMKARVGIAIDVFGNDASGQLGLEALESAIGPRTKLIAITHVPTQGLLVDPAAEVGYIVARHGILYLLDACQVGRPTRGRCAADRLPHARGRGPQVSARASRHRFPVRAARHHGEPRTALHRSSGRLVARHARPRSICPRAGWTRSSAPGCTTKNTSRTWALRSASGGLDTLSIRSGGRHGNDGARR